MVKERGGEPEPMDSSLRNLSVFLLLQKAEESGFRAQDYNLTNDQAATIAAVFSKYDLNDDFVLSTSEVNKLLCAPFPLRYIQSADAFDVQCGWSSRLLSEGSIDEVQCVLQPAGGIQLDRC